MKPEQLRALTDPQHYVGKWVKELNTELLIFVTEQTPDYLIGYGFNRVGVWKPAGSKWFEGQIFLDDVRANLIEAFSQDLYKAINRLNDGKEKR